MRGSVMFPIDMQYKRVTSLHYVGNDAMKN